MNKEALGLKINSNIMKSFRNIQMKEKRSLTCGVEEALESYIKERSLKHAKQKKSKR